MASINSDIRARSRNSGRIAVIILGLATLAFSVSFGLSFLPGFASAHTAVVSPNTVEEGGTLDIVINADDTSDVFTTGNTIKGVLWGFDSEAAATTCANISDGDVPGTLEFTVQAPNTDGPHSFYYKLSDSDTCGGTVGDIQSETDSFEVLPDEPAITTTTVVYPADLAQSLADVALNVQKWFFYNDQSGSIDGVEGINNAVGSMVVGPGTAPAGTGSAQISTPVETPNNATNVRRDIATYQFKSIKLSTIKNLSFSTYAQSAGNGAGVNAAPYLNFNVDFNGSDTWQKRLAYVPNQNGTVVADTWQSWNAADPAAKWSYSGATWPAGATSNGSISGTTARTLSDILADYPNIQTRATDSWLGFRVGEPYPGGFTGNIDNFSITTKVGVNTTTTKYDFEAAPASACVSGSSFDTATNGSVNGQEGWVETNATYDQAVVSNTYGFPTFGCKTLRISNAVTSGGFDWVYSPSATNEAGETIAATSSFSGGTRTTHYEAQFDIASAQPSAQQVDAMLSVSPDRGDGARMSYLRFEDQADGIHVHFSDYATSTTFSDVDIATLDRTQPHTIKFVIDFVDGPSNDIVKVYIDGTLKETGTTWEDYFRFDPEQASLGNKVPTIDSLLFRQGGAVVAAPATAGKGFLIDNVSVTTSTPDPVCVSGQHLDNHVCVDDTTSGSSGGNSGSGNNNGGGGIPGLIGVVNTNGQGGLVLGTSTEALPEGCSIYISGYLKQGSTGPEVKKLQSFLNTAVNAGLPITGVFGPMTFNAVKAFQLAHWDEILSPWVKFGLPSDHTPTGYVYKTTQRMINLTQCNNTISIPQPQLP